MGLDPALQGIPQFDSLEIIKTGSTTNPAVTPNNSFTRTIAHNLGFVPIPFAFLSDGTFYKQLPTWTGITVADPTNVGLNNWWECETDITNFYLRIYSAGSTISDGAFPVIYFLCRKKAST